MGDGVGENDVEKERGPATRDFLVYVLELISALAVNSNVMQNTSGDSAGI